MSKHAYNKCEGPSVIIMFWIMGFCSMVLSRAKEPSALVCWARFGEWSKIEREKDLWEVGYAGKNYGWILTLVPVSLEKFHFGLCSSNLNTYNLTVSYHPNVSIVLTAIVFIFYFFIKNFNKFGWKGHLETEGFYTKVRLF